MRTPQPSPADPAAMVAAALRQLSPCPRRLFVGFSGGADSTALLLLLHDHADRLGCELAAVHFDHGLRGRASRADAAWCRRFCELRNLPCRIIPLAVRTSQGRGEGLEAAARRLRLAAWRELAGPDDAVALGHHADDRAENLLLRLLRGSNCSGLTSLRNSQVVHGVRFVRPLLGLHKADLVAFLKARGIRDWREDVSNRDPALRRNFLREKLLPMLRHAVPETDAALAAALAALDDDAAFLEAAANDALVPHAHADALPLAFLRGLHDALRPRVLRRWMETQLDDDFIPDSNLLERLDEILARGPALAGESRRIPLPGGGELVLGRDRLRLATPAVTAPPSRSWRWRRTATLPWGDGRLRRTLCHGKVDPRRPDANSALFPVDALPATLTVRAWHEGDRMIPFGRSRPVSLKKLFVDRKILGENRFQHPLIVRPDDGAILWAVGLRHSALAPLHADEPAVRLDWEGTGYDSRGGLWIPARRRRKDYIGQITDKTKT
jgi:tRNA(Ile)-lysidine synthase